MGSGVGAAATRATMVAMMRVIFMLDVLVVGLRDCLN